MRLLPWRKTYTTSFDDITELAMKMCTNVESVATKRAKMLDRLKT